MNSPKHKTDRAAGTRLHRVIQALCRHTDPVSIGDAHKAARAAAKGRMGDPKRYSTTPDSVGDAAYHAMRLMPPLEWEVLAVEERLGDRIADIVFKSRISGLIVVVEIKTGGHGTADLYEDAREQFRDLARAAMAAYGEELYGFLELYVYAGHLTAFWPFGYECDREPLKSSGAWKLEQRIQLLTALEDGWADWDDE